MFAADCWSMRSLTLGSGIAYIAAGHYFGGPRHVSIDPWCTCSPGGTVRAAAYRLGLQCIDVFAALPALPLEAVARLSRA